MSMKSVVIICIVAVGVLCAVLANIRDRGRISFYSGGSAFQAAGNDTG